MAYTLQLDAKKCSHCKEKQPLNNWGYCESCSKRNIQLVFHDGKVWERDMYGKNPYDYPSYKDEITNFTPEEVTAFLTEQLALMTDQYDDLAGRVRKYHEATREMVVPHYDLNKLKVV